MDRLIVARKLDALQRCLRRIETNATTHLGDFQAFARVVAARLSESET